MGGADAHAAVVSVQTHSIDALHYGSSGTYLPVKG